MALTEIILPKFLAVQKLRRAFLIHAGETVHVFNFNIRKTVHELDGKILAVFHELPLADAVRKMFHHFYFQVGKTVHHFYFDVRMVLDNFYFAAQPDTVIITAGVDGGGCQNGAA